MKLFRKYTADDKQHTVLEFFNVKIKFKNKAKIKTNNFDKATVSANSVLIIEANPYHAETLAGNCEYFLNLGYNVDIFIRNEPFLENPFCRYNKRNVRFFPMSEEELKKNVASSKIARYDFIFFNSFVYKCEKYVEDYLPNIQKPKYSILGIEHDVIENSEKKFSQIKQKRENNELFIISNYRDIPMLNPHYFGKIKITPKNKGKVIFCAIGVVDKSVKDHDSLIDAIKEITKEGYTNFKVFVVGAGKLKIPAEIQQYIEFKGRLNFPDMYNIIEKADYLLALMNIDNQLHHRYLSGQASGAFQISLGFQKPLIINNEFGKHYQLNKNNAIFYEKNLLADAMKQAIDMSYEDYLEIQNSIQVLSTKIKNQSIKNLVNNLECAILKNNQTQGNSNAVKTKDKFMKIKLSSKNKLKKRLLVHLHVYYYEQIDYFISKLKNIGNCDWDLFVTVVEYKEDELEKFRKLKPDVKIIKVKNIGYDIYPFLQILANISLKNYDYVLKLHTKRYFPKETFATKIHKTIYYEWRDCLVDSLIKNKEIFKYNLKKLSGDEFGLICSQNYLFNIDKNNSNFEDIKNVEVLKNKLSLLTDYNYFIAGTMFIIRADILERLKKINLSEKDFTNGKSGTSGTIAHALERVFAILTADCGYKICAVDAQCSLIKKILESIFSVKNKDIHKIITVLGIKLKFKSKKFIDRVRIREYNNKKNELNIKIAQFNALEKEYNEYKQSQIIDKQEADKCRGEIYRYPIDMKLDEPRVYSINWINENSKVLDVGCACGELGEKLKELKNSEVIGLEYNTQSIEIAKQTGGYKDIIQCDLNKYKNIPLADKKFDYIVCSDVLEHIYEPQKVLKYFKQYLKDDGYFLLSIPNVSHASIKANLLLNSFDYTPVGLLDQTHIRFFTYKTIVNLLSDLNLEIVDCKLTHYCGLNGFQSNNPYPDIPQDIREFILKDKHSSIVQYVVKCKKSEKQDLVNINLEKINNELDNTPYMQGVQEYLI